MAVSQAILVVADQREQRDALLRLLRTDGFENLMVAAGPQASLTETVGPAAPAAMILRLQGWNREWSECLERLQRQRPELPVVVISSDSQTDAAVAMGRWEVRKRLVEPVLPGELSCVIHQILEEANRGSALPLSRRSVEPPRPTFSRLILASAAMQRVAHQAERAAQGDCPVLLLGERGTGRRLLAELIHANSERRDRPFVRVHLPAREPAGSRGGLERDGQERPVTDDLLAAHGGSLFVDEVSYLTRTAQARLLWVLEKRRIPAVGEEWEREVDLRLIAASCRNLDELVAQGRFRTDLHYRLSVVPICLPPLRERREDIAVLTRHFLDEICCELGLPSVEPEPELMRLLEGYDWPGNVRQLRDCLRSMVCLARTDRLSARDLGPPVRRDGAAVEPPRLRHEKRLAELERLAMVEALEQHGGNRTCAAEALGISVRTLQRKLKKWNTDRAFGQS